MNFEDKRRRSTSVSRRRFITGSAAALAGLPVVASGTWAAAADGVSHTADAIHQERTFSASRQRVYEALTVTAQFDHVVRLSAAMHSNMKLGSSPTEIHNQPGGTFALFGGYITGRFIELVANERIVQAWRVGSWAAGAWSIASYVLSDAGSATKLVFDHTGFPAGEADHLAAGWIGNYWEPLAKVLAQGGQGHK